MTTSTKVQATEPYKLAFVGKGSISPHVLCDELTKIAFVDGKGCSFNSELGCWVVPFIVPSSLAIQQVIDGVWSAGYQIGPVPKIQRITDVIEVDGPQWHYEAIILFNPLVGTPFRARLLVHDGGTTKSIENGYFEDRTHTELIRHVRDRMRPLQDDRHLTVFMEAITVWLSELHDQCIKEYLSLKLAIPDALR